MALRLTIAKSLAMFVYETDEMTTTVTISQTDDEATILAKLGKLTDFIRGQQPHDYRPTNAPGWTAPALPPAAPAPVTLSKPADILFGGLADSMAQATANGWELIGDED